MQKIIPIPTDERKFFRQYLELAAPLLRLREKERRVLAELLYYNYKYKAMDEEERFILIFSTSIRKKIMEELKVSDAVLNNNLSELRKKGYIVDNKIKRFYQIDPTENGTLTYKFMMK